MIFICVHSNQRYLPECRTMTLKARSIWYSGGAWDLCLGRKIFFGQYRSKVIFFTGPSGRIIFFITKSYQYRGFCENFMLNSGFRDNYMLNSGFHNKFRLNSGFCHKSRFSRQLHTARGTTRQLHSQLDALFRFSSQLHTRIYLISLCEHHSNYRELFSHDNWSFWLWKRTVYNISDHNQWRTSLKVDSNMSRGQ